MQRSAAELFQKRARTSKTTTTIQQNSKPEIDRSKQGSPSLFTLLNKSSTTPNHSQSNKTPKTPASLSSSKNLFTVKNSTMPFLPTNSQHTRHIPHKISHLQPHHTVNHNIKATNTPQQTATPDQHHSRRRALDSLLNKQSEKEAAAKAAWDASKQTRRAATSRMKKSLQKEEEQRQMSINAEKQRITERNKILEQVHRIQQLKKEQARYRAQQLQQQEEDRKAEKLKAKGISTAPMWPQNTWQAHKYGDDFNRWQRDEEARQRRKEENAFAAMSFDAFWGASSHSRATGSKRKKSTARDSDNHFYSTSDYYHSSRTYYGSGYDYGDYYDDDREHQSQSDDYNDTNHDSSSMSDDDDDDSNGSRGECRNNNSNSNTNNNNTNDDEYDDFFADWESWKKAWQENGSRPHYNGYWQYKNYYYTDNNTNRNTGNSSNNAVHRVSKEDAVAAGKRAIALVAQQTDNEESVKTDMLNAVQDAAKYSGYDIVTFASVFGLPCDQSDVSGRGGDTNEKKRALKWLLLQYHPDKLQQAGRKRMLGECITMIVNQSLR